MYVIFEGIDTCGKSTQIALLQKKYPNALFTKEPGGTPVGVAIRQMVLGGEFSSKSAELFMFLADRAEHFERVIKPNHDKLIISDRGFISGIAYALDFPSELTLPLNLLALQNTMPNKVIFLKLDKQSLEARLGSKSNDAIEARGVDYLLDIQNKIEQSIEKIGLNSLMLDANEPIETLHQKIITFLEEKEEL